MAAFQYDEGAAPEHRDSFELLPAGDYVGQVVDSEVGANSKGTGQVLKLTYELLNDGFKGRKLWQRINVQHSTSEAQRIGQIELANLKEGCGITGKLGDTLQLHNKPVGLRVKVEISDNPKYKDSNTVTDFFPANEFVPAGAKPVLAAVTASPYPAMPAPAPAAPVQPAAPAARPPWMKAA